MVASGSKPETDYCLMLPNLEGRVLFSYIVIFAIFVSVQAAGTPTSGSDLKISWSDVTAGLSLVFNAVMGILLWFLNRKRETDQELRKKDQDSLTEALTKAREADAAKQQLLSTYDQLRRDVTLLQSSIQNLADSDLVKELREDLRQTQRTLEGARVGLAEHQTVCSDRFVQRTSYSDDLRAQRETIGLIHEMLKQQRDIMDRIMRP